MKRPRGYSFLQQFCFAVLGCLRKLRQRRIEVV